MRKLLFKSLRDIFILRGPIPGNVTGSNPVPIAVWLNIYLIDINILRKYEVEKLESH